MSTPKQTDSVHRQIPDEVIDNIISLVSPTHRNTVLFTFLRVSKRYSLYVASRIYPHIDITPDTDLFAGTGLKVDYLRSRLAINGRISGGEGGDTPSLKSSFLNMIDTITVDQVISKANKVFEIQPRALTPAEAAAAAAQKRYTQLLLSKTPPTIPEEVKVTTLSHPIYCDQLTLRLDTTSPWRPSPYDQAPTPHSTHFLANVRPLRLVLRGASFHQYADPTIHLPSSLFSRLKEIVVIITPGALPDISQTYSASYGLPFLLDCLARGITSSYSDTMGNPAIDITFILETPTPESIFPVISPAPHKTAPGIFDPEFAPGYLHPLTQALGQCIARNRKVSKCVALVFDWIHKQGQTDMKAFRQSG